LASDKELNDFLRSAERRAFKRTAYLVRDDDAALDIVQDAMIRLAEKYFDRPAAELPLVFPRILSNATMDWFRRQKVRNAVMHNMSDFESSDPDGDFDLLETLESQDGGAERGRRGFQGPDPAGHRSGSINVAGASTGSLPAALLGRVGCRRDRGRDGLLRGKC